jgi:hypothetical protein
MRVGDLMASARKYEARYPGEYGLSFWSWPDMTADQIAVRVGGELLPHPELRKCTAERIRNLRVSDGRPLDLIETGRPGHYTVRLPSPLDRRDLEQLSELFDAPQPNPAATEVRRHA